MSWRVVRGDCIEAMTAMEPESVHAVVCDPPYGLEFMGKEWDRLTYAGGNPSMKTGDRPIDERDGETWQPGSAYGARQKNPRCRNCGKLARGNGACKCPTPDLDTRHAEGGFQMQAWHEAWAREALRVLKPGGHLLAFGGTRTVHRLTSGIEDAGFEIRDTLAWMYGSGFPKSLDVSKAIDKAAGAEREVTAVRRGDNGHGLGGNGQATDAWRDARAASGGVYAARDIPVTPEAQAWEGWGTALKPAYEPVVVARKPLSGTVAANVLAHGTGALNIDACRIGLGEDEDVDKLNARSGGARGFASQYVGGNDYPLPPGADLSKGRWPANVLLSHSEGCNGECVPDCPVRLLDEQTGNLGTSTGGRVANISATSTIYGGGKGLGQDLRAEDVRGDPGFGDSGGASRFFYVAKASSAERNAGLDGFAKSMPHDGASHVHADGRAWDIPGSHATARANAHPTVKPIEMMRWLVRLVTPPGGLVLDPFAGSGTTGIACVLEGFDFIGVEREPEYADIAEARIRWWSEHPEGLPLEAALAADGARRKVADTGQVSMFDLLGG